MRLYNSFEHIITQLVMYVRMEKKRIFSREGGKVYRCNRVAAGNKGLSQQGKAFSNSNYVPSDEAQRAL